MAHDGHPHHHHGGHDHPHDHGDRPQRTRARPPSGRRRISPPARPRRHPSGAEPDLDLVETAFLDAFPACPDPTSFLRLAGVPFTGKGKDGVVLSLLRVEANQATDIGTLTPHLGGACSATIPSPPR